MEIEKFYLQNSKNTLKIKCPYWQILRLKKGYPVMDQNEKKKKKGK